MSNSMNFHNPRLFMVGGLAVAMFVAAGCTTKKYVRQQTAPLMDHVNQLDAQTAKNTNAIRDTKQQTDAGIAQVNQSTENAVNQAQQAQQQAQQVSSKLDQTSGQIQSLDKTVANLEDYHQTGQATVHFAFNKSNLTPDAKQELDQVITQLHQDTHGILEVQGYTDTSGPAAYNLQLSQRRANSVVRYLEANNIAPHRIYLIGLGENQPAESNKTLAGRKFNRRVDLKILTNGLASTSQNSGQ
ncbi:MAG: OmpA family protein [Acidobacteria bacterium]|nr:MAG: OmpA family protein [Acidobacteriota bacterium]